MFVMTLRLALEYLQPPFISPKEKGRKKPRRLFPAEIKDWLRVWGTPGIRYRRTLGDYDGDILYSLSSVANLAEVSACQGRVTRQGE